MKIMLLTNPVKAINFETSSTPTLGLLSIASNLDKKHEVRIIDNFYLCDTGNKTWQRSSESRKNLYKIIEEYQPRVIGLTALSFQYKTALSLAKCIRENFKEIIIVLGGYHATLMYEEIYNSDDKKYFDFIVRNEGEITFNELVNEIETDKNYLKIKGISFYDGKNVYHNPKQDLLDLEKIKLPDRQLIHEEDYPFYNPITNQMEKLFTIETSRGCLNGCNFCCINKMYGRNYRKYSLDRVIEDLENIVGLIKGSQIPTYVLIVDDNIVSDVERFEKLCDLIIEKKLNNFKYFIQADSIGLSKSEPLIKKMKMAGVESVFVGIENNSSDNLKILGKGKIHNHTDRAVKYLQKYDIRLFGGTIVGLPEDSKKSIMELFRYLEKVGVKFGSAQILTPYPTTKIREEYLSKNLITNKENYEMYDCFWANIKTNYLSSDDLLFYKQRYWMKYLILNDKLQPGDKRSHPFKYLKYRLFNYIKYLFFFLTFSNRKSFRKYIDKTKEEYMDQMNVDVFFNVQ